MSDILSKIEGPRHHYTYKRLETDDEFRKRLIAAGADSWKVAGEIGQRLDDIGWQLKKMQRRIVDDFA